MTNFFETPADTGVTQSDALATGIAYLVSDTGVTQSEDLLLLVGRIATDTGLTQTDAFALVTARTIADTLSFSDYIGVFSRRSLSDTGLTTTQTITRCVYHYIVGTGVTNTDQFVVKSFRVVSTTGSTITDSTGAAVRPAPDSPFAFLCSRNWVTATTPTKWTPKAHNRFTYTTIAD